MSAAEAREELSADYQRLLKAVAEELKLPLTRIARQTELAELINEPAELALESIRRDASAALELVDSYLLGLSLVVGQRALQLEPVSTASVVYDVANELMATAKYYDVELALQLGGSLEPVMANSAGLKAALLSLGTAMIEAQAPDQKKSVVTIVTRHSQRGILTGFYSSDTAISTAELRAVTRQLPGVRRRPLKHFSSGSAAGIFVAQNIFNAMSAHLNATRYHKQSGLAAVLQPSWQLQMI